MINYVREYKCNDCFCYDDHYRFERQAQLTIDDGPEMIAFSPGDLVQLNVDSALYIGKLLSIH